MSDTNSRTFSRRIHFFGSVFPLLMLLFYGITFALIGGKTLYRFDISYFTYETLRIFLGVLLPIFFLLWGVVGIIIVERKTFMYPCFVYRHSHWNMLSGATDYKGTFPGSRLPCRAETVFCKRNITALSQFTKGRILSVFRPGFIIRPASRCDGFAGQS